MIFLSLILVKLLFTSADKSLDNAYCDIATKSCPDAVENFNDLKLLFYDVNPPEGFNLRRDVYMRFAIMLAEAHRKEKKKNWRLVLPPWYNLFHWRSRVPKQEPFAWSHFFQLDALKSFAPVLEFNEIFGEFSNNAIEIDVLYILQSYRNTFEDGYFEEKWETTEECYYDGEFWGYNNLTVKETICVHFQGKISMLWELIWQHPSAKTVMFAHGEIPLHEHYGSKAYWNCRNSMKFSKRLVNVAAEYIAEELFCNDIKCETYIAVHWRRRDFARSRGSEVPSVEGTASQINKAITEKQLNIQSIFVATDGTTEEIRKLKKMLSKYGHELKIYTPKDKYISELKDADTAIIEQIICSRATYFIGTHESTFTYRIQEEREIMGFLPTTTYNRLCPDAGECEKTPRWTIVY